MSELPAHSILSASGMYRWSVCPGSVRLCKDVPPKTNKYADEGTLAHTKLEKFMRGDLPAQEFAELPEDMKKALLLTSQVVDEDYQSDKDARLFLEHKFDLSSVYPGCFGTADIVLWLPKRKKLIVYDFKYGAGVVVHPEKNLQMLYYALGAVVTLKFKAEVVELVVIQPRAPHKKGPVRRWATSAMDILDFEVELVDAAQRTEDPLAPLNPGRHCWFCPAHETCPAIYRQRVEKAKDEFTDVSSIDDICVD